MVITWHVQLPWYRVLGMTAAPGTPGLNTWWVPTALLSVAIAVGAGLWHYGATLEARQRTQVP